MENIKVAACGLACAECRKFIGGKCPGCAKYEKATWCEIRTCCKSHDYISCADCQIMPLADCKKFNNFIGKVFKVLFRSDRNGCIERIKKVGYDQYLAEMHQAKSMNRPKKD